MTNGGHAMPIANRSMGYNRREVADVQGCINSAGTVMRQQERTAMVSH
eukprot:CAMPEP_0175769720 /NCGR_PEP_ID=MMETSP0097-20121207/71108_1 /TAXON_ID=311494 /ORGANISM="Alexandrium monilatum, Strain CCMP3105" /LENGTH=47 /DNA_ID= /DNA_START= /DNA_END= /DNA_ORIENTATION=